jgi:hypothetical protein
MLAWESILRFGGLMATLGMTIVYQVIIKRHNRQRSCLPREFINAMGHVVGLTCGLELGPLRRRPRSGSGAWLARSYIKMPQGSLFKGILIHKLHPTMEPQISL